MANYPGSFGALPSCDPTYSVEIDEAGNYSISWGKFYGSPRDIAKQIILKYLKEPEGIPRKDYVGPFFLVFKTEARCMFCQGYTSRSGVNSQELAQSISKELQSLKILIPFS